MCLSRNYCELNYLPCSIIYFIEVNEFYLLYWTLFFLGLSILKKRNMTRTNSRETNLKGIIQVVQRKWPHTFKKNLPHNLHLRHNIPHHLITRNDLPARSSIQVETTEVEMTEEEMTEVETIEVVIQHTLRTQISSSTIRSPWTLRLRPLLLVLRKNLILMKIFWPPPPNHTQKLNGSDLTSITNTKGHLEAITARLKESTEVPHE